MSKKQVCKQIEEGTKVIRQRLSEIVEISANLVERSTKRRAFALQIATSACEEEIANLEKLQDYLDGQPGLDADKIHELVKEELNALQSLYLSLNPQSTDHIIGQDICNGFGGGERV